jgi:hypothetical protein
MLGQRTTRWFASREAPHLDPCARSRYLRGCLGLGSIFLRVRQLELFEDRPPLRGLADVYLSLSISSARLASLSAANRAARSLSSNAFRTLRDSVSSCNS